MTVEELRERYEDPEAIAVFEERAAQCTGQARLVRRIEGERVCLFGFSNGNNPGTIVDDPDDPEEGHHFAVLDGRFIVDPWMHSMSLDGKEAIGRAVFDLADPEDAGVVAACYGDRSTWVRLEDHERGADRESLPAFFAGGATRSPGP